MTQPEGNRSFEQTYELTTGETVSILEIARRWCLTPDRLAFLLAMPVGRSALLGESPRVDVRRTS